jgi:hypothetical protein
MGQGWQSASRQLYIFVWNWNAGLHLWTDFFSHKGISSVFGRLEFISGRLSYILPRGHWYDITVLNVHAPTQDESSDKRVRFYEN